MISDNPDLTIEQLRDIVQDAHLNFLLGAGASAGMFRLLGDIENVLTAIEPADVATEVKRRARASVCGSFFESVVLKNKELLSRSPAATNLLDSYSAFLQTINRVLLRRRSSIINKQVNLFTTNVDLAVEVASEDLQLELNDGFSGRFSPRFSTSNFGSVLSGRSLQYDNLSEIPTFNLLKLHGSVGWATRERELPSGETRAEIAFDGTLEQVQAVESALGEVKSALLAMEAKTTADDLLGAELPETATGDLNAFLAAYGQLAIVNPTKAKFEQTVLNQNYYDLLRIFSNELEKENSVLFVVGFSCRDEHIRELMVRAARTNPTLQIIIFAYQPQSIAEVATQFDGYPITNGNIRVVGPAEAAEGTDQERYDLSALTSKFFEPLVPRSARPAEPSVNVNVTLQEPLVRGND